jgi:transposase-like protein
MINEAADRVPAVVTRTGRQRQFSEEDKQRFVEETCRPGQSLSAAARRYGIDLRLLVRWRRALGVGGSAAPTSFVSVERRRVGLETTRMCRPWQRRCRAVSSGEIAAQHCLLHAVGIDGCDVCEARISPRCF